MMGVLLYLSVAILSILLAYRVVPQAQTVKGSKTEAANRYVLTGLILFLSLISALRVNTGNDYQTYIDHFHDVYVGNYVVTEPGFNILVKGIYGALDGEYYLVIFAVFALATVTGSVLAIYGQSNDFVMSFSLFMLFGLYFQSFNTVRYYFVLALAIYAYRCVIRREYVRFLAVIVIAAAFHKSVLLVIPLYLIAVLPWKKWLYPVIGTGIVSGWIFKDVYTALFFRYYPSYENETQYFSGNSVSWVNVARIIAVLALCYWLGKDTVEKDRKQRFYLHLNVMALALYIGFYYLPFLSRIGYYMSAGQIFLIPEMLARAGDKEKKILRIAIYALAAIYFLFFLREATKINIRILPYSTWLTAAP